MVEAPSNRVFIVAVSFLAIYGALVAFMPYELVSGAPNFRSTTYDEFYESSEIETLANTFTQNITYSGGNYNDAWGTDEDFGHSFFFITHDTSEINATWRMFNYHYYPLVLVVEWRTGSHAMDWVAKETGETYDSRITNLHFNEVSEESDAGAFNLTMARFLVKCDHVTMHATVYFNSTAYANSTQAWQNDALFVEFAIEWDELGTGLNGWNLLSSVLWFQAPDVHPAINFFLAFPLWVDIALITFKVIMVVISVLPFT